MPKFVIPFRLDGLNEYTRKNRSNKYAGHKTKLYNESFVYYSIREAKLQKITKYPVELKITWYEPNLRRDVDNITFAVKFILDALVKQGILENDSQKYVNKISHEVLVDKNKARVEVEII